MPPSLVAHGSNLIASVSFNFNLLPPEGNDMRRDTDSERRPIPKEYFIGHS
jgi:hypothetical protein